MTEEPESAVQAARDRRVPDEWLQKLHEATERFHQAKTTLDTAMQSEEYAHQQTIDHASSEMKTAEREVEAISLQIHSMLKPPPPVEPGH